MASRFLTPLAGLGLVAAIVVPGDAADTKAECCFNNPQYSGTCEVTPTGDETCRSILEYLNNPLSNGKDYCSGTQIRDHWTRVSCAKPSPSPKPDQTSRGVKPSRPARAAAAGSSSR